MKLFIPALVLVSWMTQAQDVSTRIRHYNLQKQIALEGYDPVSYWEGKPVEGKETITAAYEGVTYLFATTSNANKFKAAPQKYEPAYGGWCAYAMGASGEKVKVDPETFKIVNGKLYLFYNFWGNNTLKDWNENEQPLKAKADQNWKKIVE